MTPITRGLARDSCRSIQQELSNITSSHPLLLYQIQGVPPLTAGYRLQTRTLIICGQCMALTAHIR